jgi:hypothetical protein
MKSVVELDVNVPQRPLAELYANPEYMTEWMDDLDRYEPLRGEPGAPGSQFRLVPKSGDMVFVATVVSRALPDEVRLQLDASTVAVAVKARFVPRSPETTRLVSEEVFTFKGVFNTLFGMFARASIRKAHRRHIEAFKRFAER